MADQPRPNLTTAEKALALNLDPNRYGTFAEIGAGQEVVRWFFRVGGAAGSVSKSISAYDMQVSDAIYGQCERYVSRPRLEAMLASEQKLNRDRLATARGSSTCFFSFADTVSARNYQGTNECHAWMGIQYQARPGADDSRVVVHVRMRDETNAAQQEALGIVGVNLIYGAFELHEYPEQLIASLIDNLSTDRIEIDMIEFSGATWESVDNRVMSLKLVQLGLTGAAMFAADGTALQPSEVLRKRALLVQRGRFRPLTLVNLDLLNAARIRLATHVGIDEHDILPLMEISMHNLIEDSNVCLDDFVSRAEAASAADCVVMVSDFREYHRLTAYLARYTQQPIGLAMGLGNLRLLFDEKFYADLDGGILESFGRLFKEQVSLLVYPHLDASGDHIATLTEAEFDKPVRHLFDYLRERGHLIPLDAVSSDNLRIRSPDVLRMIQGGDRDWMRFVPARVASKIVEQRLFGYRSAEDLPEGAPT